jgi:CHAD domain-containing protein
MGTTQVEIERKYDVAADAVVPALGGVGPVAGVDEPVTVLLEAVYHDTADLALARSGVTLRRRTGGQDSGWHLKQPVTKADTTGKASKASKGDAGGRARSERHEPLGGGNEPVPSPLLEEVRALVRNHPVEPVVTLSTRRVVHRLRDERGAVLAELADDTVTARGAGADGAVDLDTWREWEVELVEGEPGLLDAVEPALLDAGARPAAGPSKLARALSGRLAELAGPPLPKPSRRRAAGLVVQRYLQAQLAEVLGHDPGVRLGGGEAVHKMRVATRRTRSLLSTYRPLLDRSVTDPLRAELKWLAGALGEARDAQVMWDRLDAMVAAEPGDLATRAVRERMDAELRATHEGAQAAAVEALGSARYFRLLDALEDLARQPPWTALALGSAQDVLPARVRKDWRRVRSLVRAARRLDPGEERDRQLHEVRKAAKRLRYAAEVVVPVFGRKAGRLAVAAEDMQEVLGDLHDSVVTRTMLLQLAADSRGHPDNALLYGRLHAEEEQHARRVSAQFEAVWHAVSRPSMRRWLRP